MLYKEVNLLVIVTFKTNKIIIILKNQKFNNKIQCCLKNISKKLTIMLIHKKD